MLRRRPQGRGTFNPLGASQRADVSWSTQVESSATWQANTLIIVSKVAAIGVQFTDKMTLSADGNTLTSAVRIDTAQGGVDVTVVFDRK